MNPRTTGILAVVAALLGGFIYFYEIGGEATRKSLTTAQYAASVADLWRKGLGQWGQDGQRIQRLHDAAEMAIYTPGSTAGLPLTVVNNMGPVVTKQRPAFNSRIQLLYENPSGCST